MKTSIRISVVGGICILLLLLMASFSIMPARPVFAQTAGTNWIGQFYKTPDLTGDVQIASFPTGLNVNWGTGAPLDGFGNPIPDIPADNFSARFVTTVQFETGLYEFVATVDDGVRIYIDGLLVVDRFNATGLNTSSTLLNIPGGAATLIVEYVDRTGPAVIQVNWFTSSGTPLPTATAQPIAVGVVQQVRGLAVRTGPYLGASLVAVAKPDNTYPLLARNESEGLFTWYLIQYDEDTQGWASGRYLGVSGDETLLPLTGSIFDQIDNAPFKGVIGTTRSVMNFRVRPSVRTALISQIPWGAQVEIIGRTRQGYKDFWYQVRYNNKIGWIFAPYVGITSGLIDAVPVR